MSIYNYEFTLGESDLKFPCSYLTEEDVYSWLFSKIQYVNSPALVGVDIETYAREQFKGHPDAGLLSVKSKIRTIQFYNKKTNQTTILDLMDEDGVYLLKKENISIKLQDYLSSNKLVAHNALFETQHLQHLFYRHKFPYHPLNILCTMNAFRLCIQAAYNDPITYKADLKSVTKMILGIHIPKEQQMSDWSKIGRLSIDQIKYCAYDAILPVLLIEKLATNLEQLKMEKVYKLNTKAQEVVAHMNLHGIAFNKEQHDLLCEDWKAREEEFYYESLELLNKDKCNISKEELKEILLAKIPEKYKEIIWKNTSREFLTLDNFLYEKNVLEALLKDNKVEDLGMRRAYKRFLINLNSYLVSPNSSKQISDWLRQNVPEEAKSWPVNEKSGQLKTDADTLEEYEHLDIVAPICKFKNYAKLSSTYGEGLKKFINYNPEDDCFVIHPNFSLCYTETGRMSAFNPNVQNPPKLEEFRKLFIARPNYKLLVADFSQIEIRVFAYISEDPEMIEVYNSGGDIHSATATAISGKTEENTPKDEWKHIRFMAKAINFCVLFGGGAETICKYAKQNFKVDMTISQAEEYLQAFREKYETARKWQMGHTSHCEKTLSVVTKLGKVRELHPDYYYTTSLNTIIQGTAAEILLLALINLFTKINNTGIDGRIKNAVHDEIVCDCRDYPETIEKMQGLIKESMEEAMLYVFPEATTLNLVEVGVGDNWVEAKG